MDFNFDTQFQVVENRYGNNIDVVGKLQNTRELLQESLSENNQLIEIIQKLYSEARVENVAISEVLNQIMEPFFKNVPLPRNADNLPMSEQAGYAVYYLKFLGFAVRKLLEELHETKEQTEYLYKSITKNVLDDKIERTGQIKLPELDGVKELKRNPEIQSPPSSSTPVAKAENIQRATVPPSPPATPPKSESSQKVVRKSK